MLIIASSFLIIIDFIHALYYRHHIQNIVIHNPQCVQQDIVQHYIQTPSIFSFFIPSDFISYIYDSQNTDD